MSLRSIRSIGHRMIVDSHVGFTTEFVVELDDGAIGTGSSSQGETISIYEDRGNAVDPKRITDAIRRDGQIGVPIDTAQVDRYLFGKIGDFGRNNCFALSLAFFDAVTPSSGQHASCALPRLCLNVLNGGYHAYTNPVLSDFSEFMIVAKSNDVFQTVLEHNLVQDTVRQRLLSCEKAVVNGNPVNKLSAEGNAAPFAFLAEVLSDLELTDKYDLMIDASAGDLTGEGGYLLAITEDQPRTSQDLSAYWLELIETFGIGFLEDPFQETDFAAWSGLTESSGPGCTIIGDNLYSSEAARIRRGAEEGLSNATIVKPNQAGTVSATVAAIEAANTGGLTVITSHRSISTESTYVCDVTCECQVPYIKIGPLLSDYSSVIRLNQLIRLSGVGNG